MLFFLVCVCAGQKAFSYNTDVSVCTRAPGGPNKCCALKSSIPASQPSHFKPGQVTTGYKYEPPAGIPHPSARQQEYMDMGLTQFMHFSVTTFGNIEHDCYDGSCLPATMFNPTNMGPDENNITATDQCVCVCVCACACACERVCVLASHCVICMGVYVLLVALYQVGNDCKGHGCRRNLLDGVYMCADGRGKRQREKYKTSAKRKTKPLTLLFLCSSASLMLSICFDPPRRRTMKVFGQPLLFCFDSDSIKASQKNKPSSLLFLFSFHSPSFSPPHNTPRFCFWLCAGGFCLWPTQFSNYSVMQSQYKHDIVADFVASCRKYDIRPCFYIGPNANGYFTQVSASQKRGREKEREREGERECVCACVCACACVRVCVCLICSFPSSLSLTHRHTHTLSPSLPSHHLLSSRCSSTHHRSLLRSRWE